MLGYGDICSIRRYAVRMLRDSRCAARGEGPDVQHTVLKDLRIHTIAPRKLLPMMIMAKCGSAVVSSAHELLLGLNRMCDRSGQRATVRDSCTLTLP